MKRPEQHGKVEAWLEARSIPVRTWRAFARLAFAPPNLRFAGPILKRLSALTRLDENPFGDIPDIVDAQILQQLYAEMERHAPALDAAVLRDFVASPSAGKDRGLSALNHYCVSEYPVWCALTLSSSDACAAAFDRLAASVTGEMVRFVFDQVTNEAYLDYRARWQRRHERDERSKELPEIHPLPKLGVLAEVERCLRALTLPEHDDAWKAVIATGHPQPEEHLEDVAILPLRFSATRELISTLFAALERFESSGSRAQRKLSQQRRNPHFQPLGQGRFIQGLDWIVEIPAEDNLSKRVAEVLAIPARAQYLLSQDYSLDELAEPTGLVMHLPEGADKDLPYDALQVITKWSYQAQQSRNQLLRWSLDTLTPRQIADLLHILCAPGIDLSKESEPDLEFRMLWIASVNTGLQRGNLAGDLQISLSTRRTLSTRVDYLLTNRLFRVATNLPDLAHLLADRSGARARNFIHIPDRTGFHFVAEEYLRRKGARNEGIRIEMPTCARDRLGDLIAAAGIRESQIYQCLPRKVLEMTGSQASISLWGDWRPSITKTLTHYLSPLASIVERPIDVALIELVSSAKSLSEPGLMRFVDAVVHIKDDRRIGAPDCPSSFDVRTLINSYGDRLAEAPGIIPEQIAAYSNTYMSYHAFYQAAALGYRASIDPSPYLFEIKGRWFAIFSDKDSRGFHQRIVAVPVAFVRQLQYFKRHQDFMRSLPFFNFTKAQAGSMFWLSGTTAVPFSPKHATSDAGANWKYRLNAMRRRMRTRLFERGAPGEVSDVWMGQWTLGNCPWMTGSAFQSSELVDLMERHVTPILDEDGWRPIESTMTRGLLWAAA